MRENLVAYLRDWDKPASLENIDLDSYKYLKKMRIANYPFEFGGYNPRDGSVAVTIDIPDDSEEVRLEQLPKPESQAEWENKRAWYLKYAPTDPKLFLEACCWGYILDEEEWQVAQTQEVLSAAQGDSDIFNPESDYEFEYESYLRRRKNRRK